MRVRRRGFIGVPRRAAAWPLAGYAQQPERVRRVGALLPYGANDAVTHRLVTAIAHVLGASGWVEGKDIRIEYRFAAGDPTLFETYAAELVGLSPDAILASTTPAVAAVQQKTRTIPIVFVLMVDPIGQGFVQSLARPGTNITGFSVHEDPILGKWLQLLKEVAPSVTRIAVIFNPDTAPFAPLFNRAILAAAPSLGMTVTLARVHDDSAIEETIAAQAREPGGGLIMLPESFTFTHAM